MEHLVIAIDGPGGSGKTTVSQALAKALGVAHLDTGAFYRAVTLAALRAGISAAPDLAALAKRIDLRYEDGHMYLDGEDVCGAIRSEPVNAFVSAVSAEPAVRRAMVECQRHWVQRHDGRAVVEGRDIGTVVFPHAELKVFLVARPEVRAARRAHELDAPGVENVQEDLARRDHLDSSRAVSPLSMAEDAITIDTSDVNVDDVVEHILTML
ncbi:MAG TPA: (d)CMP kinase [Actinobacteria bacterium]|nr:(d)CMP kinase [Actinomycetota bacterium]HDL49408.1 (d)CMP kinase [Actinomycetota bacterium]